MKLPSKKSSLSVLAMAAMVALLFVAPDVLAQDAQTTTCNVMGKVLGVLKYISLAVVTIAIVFAGYQIAFAHKRISEVAPILIGGLLIGAAGSIAGLMLGNSKGCGENTTTTAYMYPQLQLIVKADRA